MLSPCTGGEAKRGFLQPPEFKVDAMRDGKQNASQPQSGALSRAFTGLSIGLAVIVFGLQNFMPAGAKPSDFINGKGPPELNDLCRPTMERQLFQLISR